MSKKRTEDLSKKCGIVMPISECDGCDETHWQEVLTLIKRSAEKAGFEAMLVSEADDVGVIQKRIVQNLYACPVAVCDISGRNANVMFELGMRLAFDKPTIIIKDDATPFSFDTSPVEHVTYPRSLRFSKMEKFQEQLADKIKKSAESNGEDSFLKSFGSFKVADISVEKAPVNELLLDEISTLKNEIRGVRNSLSHTFDADRSPYFGMSKQGPSSSPFKERFSIGNEFGEKKVSRARSQMARLRDLKGIEDVELQIDQDEGFLEITYSDRVPISYRRSARDRVMGLLSDF